VAACRATATHRPILCIALLGRDHVSRVALPTQLCADHRDEFAAGFLTPARRAQVERTLESRGRDAPDWERTHLEFA
jgi:hypothetical protein